MHNQIGQGRDQHKALSTTKTIPSKSTHDNGNGITLVALFAVSTPK